MWPFKKIRINACDRKEREVRFLEIPIFQYGHRKFNGFEESYLKIFPKSFEHKALDKIISFLPKDNTYDHVWIVRSGGMGEAQSLNFFMKGLTYKWKVRKPCLMSQKGIYKDLFALYTDIPFYHIDLEQKEYAFYLPNRNVKYKKKTFHLWHCTLGEAIEFEKKWGLSNFTHAVDWYKELSGISFLSNIELVFKQDVIDSAERKIIKNKLNIENFVFLAPYANTTKKLEEDVWKEIADQFRRKGYDVYVNTVGGRSKIGKSAQLSICEAAYIASRAKRIVALRSGFSELLASIKNRGNLIIVYSSFRKMTPTNFFKVFTLTKYPFYDHKKTDEYIYNGKKSELINHVINIEGK